MPGLRPDDVDVLELYDPFSFEIIRQLEAFGFCARGRGRTIRRRRAYRDRRQPSRHHRRRNHVVQPRGHQSADDAARHSSRSAAARPGGRPAGSRRAYRVVQQRGSGGLIHHTCCFWETNRVTSDTLHPQSGPVPHASSHRQRSVLGGLPSRGIALSTLRGCGLANFPPSEHCR